MALWDGRYADDARSSHCIIRSTQIYTFRRVPVIATVIVPVQLRIWSRRSMVRNRSCVASRDRRFGTSDTLDIIVDRVSL